MGVKTGIPEIQEYAKDLKKTLSSKTNIRIFQ
jgi:hypothetical protein